MAGIIQLNDQFYRAVLRVTEEEIDVFGGNLVESSLPIGPIEALLGSKHIRDADFGEDKGLVAHGFPAPCLHNSASRFIFWDGSAQIVTKPQLNESDPPRDFFYLDSIRHLKQGSHVENAWLRLLKM